MATSILTRSGCGPFGYQYLGMQAYHLAICLFNVQFNQEIKAWLFLYQQNDDLIILPELIFVTVSFQTLFRLINYSCLEYNY